MRTYLRCLPGVAASFLLIAGLVIPTFASQQEDQPDIDWFKKEMGISLKYTEHESGVMGLSWAHSLTMVFLVLSLVTAVVALIFRYWRTRELLTLILKEGTQDDGKG